MGFFNILCTTVNCAFCKKNVNIKIQFKYGENWIKNYVMGDEIIWGQYNFCDRYDGIVVLDALGENCPICGECSDYYIFIINNIISSVELNDGRYVFNNDYICKIMNKDNGTN